MKLVIFGASGPTGQHLFEQALAEGHQVTAVTRSPDAFLLDHASYASHERLVVMHGDVFDFASVAQAIAGQDAVLSTLGVPFSRQEITVYSQGAEHMIQAMKQHGVRRLIVVSSSATEPHDHAQAGFFFNKVIQPFVVTYIGRTLYDDMQRMEALVMDSGLDWTIIRPSGLFETDEVTDYQMAESHISGIYTARADLAASMLRQLTTDEYLHKVVAVATFEEKPNLVRMLLREWFGKYVPFV